LKTLTQSSETDRLIVRIFVGVIDSRLMVALVVIGAGTGLILFVAVYNRKNSIMKKSQPGLSLHLPVNAGDDGFYGGLWDL
jgi:hypothetical protein